jgi:ankyrin repeat protein
VVQLIESSPASRTAHDSSGRTPYDIAAANQCTESLLQLLREPVLAEAADDVASKSNARLSPPPPPPPPPSPPGDTPPLPSPLGSADVIVEAVEEVETVEAVKAEATEVAAAKVE